MPDLGLPKPDLSKPSVPKQGQPTGVANPGQPGPGPLAPAAPGIVLSTTGTVFIAIGALYFGRDILIPLAIAILLSFVLTPLVLWLRRTGLPRIPAVVAAVLLAFAIIGAISVLVGMQVVQLADNIPTYQRTIAQKMSSLRSSAAGSGLIARVTGSLKELGKELSTPDAVPQPSSPGAGTATPKREPVPVTIEPGSSRPLEIIMTVAGPLLGPLGTGFIVIVFVIFILLEREDLRDRFIKLAGIGDLQRSTEALNEAATRVSRYLLMQLIVNVSYGIPIGIGLYMIGVPNAVLWGLLAAVLRFIPYLGPWLAAIFPIALAFGVDPGWSMLLWTVALFLAMELLSNNVLEPWLYGSSTGLSSFAIIVAAIFWTLLWGPAGLFLATPLTVCLVVIGRYVPRLEFLGVLLSNEPVLQPEERFYQRLLAGNVEEAVEIAEDYVDDHSSLAFYDEIAIPALRLAENDRQRSSDVTFRRVVADTAFAVVREIDDHVRETDKKDKSDPEGTPPSSDHRQRVLCIGGRSELGQAAAEMVAQRLAEIGIAAEPLAPMAVNQNAIGQLDLDGVSVVCLSYLDPRPQVYARYVCRRLKRRAPHLRIVVCSWNTGADDPALAGLKGELGADAVVATLYDAEKQICAWLESPFGEQPTAVVEADGRERDALRELGMTSASGAAFDEMAARVAETFKMPIALVSLVDEEQQRWSAAELPAKSDAARTASHDTSICTDIVAAGEPLVIEDVKADPRFADNPALLEKGIRFYAGAPLRTSSGNVLGALCVIDSKPRTFDEAERQLLQSMADELMQHVERGNADDPQARPTGATPDLSQGVAQGKLATSETAGGA